MNYFDDSTILWYNNKKNKNKQKIVVFVVPFVNK